MISPLPEWASRSSRGYTTDPWFAELRDSHSSLSIIAEPPPSDGCYASVELNQTVWTCQSKKGRIMIGAHYLKWGVVLNSHLMFNSHIGRVKRVETDEDNPACPFCSRERLEEILDEDGSIILVKNKYPVFGKNISNCSHWNGHLWFWIVGIP